MPGISPHYNSHRSIFLFSALNSTPTFTTSRLSDKESDSLFHQSAAKPARQSHSVYIYLGVFTTASVPSNLTINFLKRYPAPFSPNSFISIPDSTRNYHIYFSTMRQLKQPFESSAIQAFQGAGIISFVRHSNHKCLSSKCTGFMYHHTHITFRYFEHHRAENADNISK